MSLSCTTVHIARNFKQRILFTCANNIHIGNMSHHLIVWCPNNDTRVSSMRIHWCVNYIDSVVSEYSANFIPFRYILYGEFWSRARIKSHISTITFDMLNTAALLLRSRLQGEISIWLRCYYATTSVQTSGFPIFLRIRILHISSSIFLFSRNGIFHRLSKCSFLPMYKFNLGLANSSSF